MGRPRKDRPGKEELERLYGELGTMKAVAEKVGINIFIIRELFNKYKIIHQPKPKRLKELPIERETLEKLYEEFGDFTKIAKIVGVSYNTITRWFRKYKIKQIFTENTPTKLELENLYKKYGSLSEIIKNTGISAFKLQKYLKKHNFKIRRELPTKDILEELYKEQKTQRKVGLTLGIPYSTIHKLFRKYNIKTIPQKQLPNRDKLVELYAKYGQIKLVAEKTGLSYTTILKLFDNYNIKFRTDKNILEKNELIKLYEKHKTIDGVAAELNLHRETIRKLFKKYNIEHIIYHRTYTFDETFFDQIDNPNMWYWQGFMAADACIRDDDGIKIVLARKDIKHLEKFRNDIDPTPIIPINLTTHLSSKNKILEACSISIYSAKMTKSLEKYNIIPRKTYSLTFSENIINSPYLNIYFRGFIDGDGGYAIYNNRLVCYICGRYEFINNFNKILVEKAKLPTAYLNIILNKNKNAVDNYSIKYGGQSVCKQIINWLYQDLKDNPNAVYLDRKYEIIKPYLDFNLIDMSNIEYKGKGLKLKL